MNGLGEVLEDQTPDGHVNWDKFSKFADHIWSVKRFMRARYLLKPVPEIQHYIETAVVWEYVLPLVSFFVASRSNNRTGRLTFFLGVIRRLVLLLNIETSFVKVILPR